VNNAAVLPEHFATTPVPITTFNDGSGCADVMLFQNSLTRPSLQPGGRPLDR
jgi:hypothetical protein